MFTLSTEYTNAADTARRGKNNDKTAAVTLANPANFNFQENK